MPYTSISQAKGAGFPTKAEGITLTLDQINKLADIYDGIKERGGAKTPFAVAWTQWKKIYKKAVDSWVVKKASDIAQMVYPVKVEDFHFAEGSNLTDIQVLKIGDWKHPVYGRIKISEKDLNEFVKNFDSKIRKDLPITEGHSVGSEEKPAIGWFTQLVNKGRDGLWAAIEWTKGGKKLLQEKAYKYFSPEFYSVYEDPETHKTYKNVLVGGALTNRPYFKGLAAVVLSEKYIYKEMKIEDILKKDPTELTDEETKEIKDNKDTLSDENKEKFKSVLEEGEEGGDEGKDEGKTDEGKTDEGKKDEGEDDEGKKEGEDDKDKKEGSEVVQIDKKTLSILESSAKQGVEAMAILRKKEAMHYAESVIISKDHLNGRLLPKSKNGLVAFMLTLTKDRQEKFKEIIDELPKSRLFTELGKAEGVDITASEQVQSLVKEKMDKDPELSYRPALEQVQADNPELAEQLG